MSAVLYSHVEAGSRLAVSHLMLRAVQRPAGWFSHLAMPAWGRPCFRAASRQAKPVKYEEEFDASEWDPSDVPAARRLPSPNSPHGLAAPQAQVYKHSWPRRATRESDTPPETYVHGLLSMASTPDHVLDIVDENRDSFDLVNYAAALTKLHQLQRKKAAHKQTALPLARVGDLVHQATLSAAEFQGAMSPRSIATLSWAVAKTRVPARALFDVMAAQALPQMHRMRPGDVAMLSWALSAAGHCPPELSRALADRVVAAPELYATHELTNVLTSLAALRADVPQMYATVAAELTARNAEQALEPWALASTLHGLAKARYYEPAVYEQLGTSVRVQARRCTVQGLASMLWAYQQAGVLAMPALTALTHALSHKQRGSAADAAQACLAARAMAGLRSQLARQLASERGMTARAAADAASTMLAIAPAMASLQRAMTRHLEAAERGVDPAIASQKFQRSTASPVQARDIAEFAAVCSELGQVDPHLTALLARAGAERARDMTMTDFARWHAALQQHATPRQAVPALQRMLSFDTVRARLLKHCPPASQVQLLCSLASMHPAAQLGPALPPAAQHVWALMRHAQLHSWGLHLPAWAGAPSLRALDERPRPALHSASSSAPSVLRLHPDAVDQIKRAAGGVAQLSWLPSRSQMWTELGVPLLRRLLARPSECAIATRSDMAAAIAMSPMTTHDSVPVDPLLLALSQQVKHSSAWQLRALALALLASSVHHAGAFVMPVYMQVQSRRGGHATAAGAQGHQGTPQLLASLRAPWSALLADTLSRIERESINFEHAATVCWAAAVASELGAAPAEQAAAATHALEARVAGWQHVLNLGRDDASPAQVAAAKQLRGTSVASSALAAAWAAATHLAIDDACPSLSHVATQAGVHSLATRDLHVDRKVLLATLLREPASSLTDHP